MVEGFKAQLTSSAETCRSVMIAWANNVKNWFTQSSYGGINRTTFQNYAKDIVSGFGSGITTSYNSSKSSMTSWASNVKSWFSEIASYSAFYNIGKDVVNGFNAGINDFTLLLLPICANGQMRLRTHTRRRWIPIPRLKCSCELVKIRCLATILAL